MPEMMCGSDSSPYRLANTRRRVTIPQRANWEEVLLSMKLLL